MELTPEVVLKTLSKMKSKTSFSVDCVSNKILKSIAPIIILPLVHVYNLSLCSGYVHCTFKTSILKPLFKCGVRSEFTNYRPIYLISALAKLLEKCAMNQIIAHFERYNLLYKHQYGFRPNHSTVHAILNFCNNVHSALDDDSFNLAVFIDLKKAFDTVDFSVLLAKLEHYGVTGRANAWFRSYLTERIQYTEINGVRSYPRTVTVGVPQGSVAGPFLFLILINDLFRANDAATILFADDTTVQVSGRSLVPLFDRMNLNLKRMEQWFRANFLTLNASKTKYMLFKNKNMHVHDIDLVMDDTVIERVGSQQPTKTFKFLERLNSLVSILMTICPGRSTSNL